MADSDSDARWGCVIGRFQPFHNDHLTLVQEAFEFHGRVIVAVTNADPSWQVSVREAPHRHLATSNPFTFWQRHELICAALDGVVPPDSLRIVPFAIHDASLWRFYLRDDAVCWLRNRGPWEARKASDLATRYEVHQIPGCRPEVTGTRIRQLLAEGNPEWRTMVPPGVAVLVEQWRADGLICFFNGSDDDS